MRLKLFQSLSRFILAAALVVSPFVAANAQSTSFSNDQVQQIQQIVHDYLVQNPQVLIEASQALQKQEMAKAAKTAQSGIAKNAKAIFADPASPVVGNPKGDVTVVEFFDYQCPHCKDMAAVIDQVIKNDKNVRVVFKELPIFGGNSRSAALASLAVAKEYPAKYLQFHTALMAAQNPLSEEKIMQVAKSQGIDVAALKKAMDSSALKQQIQDNFKLAQDLAIMGTPTFVVSKWQVGSDNNDVSKAAFVPGATTADNLQQLIKQARS